MKPQITTSADWIKVYPYTTNVAIKNAGSENNCRYYVEVDFANAPVGEAVKGWVKVNAGEEEEQILVSVFNPADLNIERRVCRGQWCSVYSGSRFQ